jgi:hypothetical protein
MLTNYIMEDKKYKLLGQKAKEQYPELKDMSVEQAAKFIREKAYKGLDKFREVQGLGNAITVNPAKLKGLGAHASAGQSGITVKPFENKDNSEQLGYLMHEYGHQLDSAGREYAKKKEKNEEYKKTDFLDSPIKKLKLLKYRNIDEVKNAAEEMRKNYPKGKMDKFLDDPKIKNYESEQSDPGLEKDYPHHFDRDFRNDNLRNIDKGGLEEVVQAEPKYKKLKKLLA